MKSSEIQGVVLLNYELKQEKTVVKPADKFKALQRHLCYKKKVRD